MITSGRHRLLPLAAFLVCSAAFPASGWWDGGHKVIAQLAYNRLNPEERLWVVELLQKHPTYHELFATPMLEELGTSATIDDQHRWLFSQAAVWADLVRYSSGYESAQSISETYNLPPRHYTDLPVFATEADRLAMEPALEVAETKWQPGLTEPDHELNSMQAIAKGLAEVGDPSLPIASRSVELTWLFHLIGDTHQPCHCAQLFLRDQLPDGDRGANSILILGLKNQSHGMNSDTLHAFWDSLFNGETNTHTDILSRTQDLETAAQTWKSAPPVPTQIDHLAWWQEGHRIAVEKVYPPDLLQRLATAPPPKEPQREGRPPIVMISLPAATLSTYVTNAKLTAKGQVYLAGVRLAATLSHLHEQANGPAQGE